MSVAADIASLRTRYQSIATLVYDDRCSVLRVTQTDDNRGGWTETWATVASDIPCAFVPYKTGQKEVVVAGQVKGMADGDVWLPALFDDEALDINEKDRLAIAANGAEPERTLEIIFPAPHQGILIQAAAVLVTPGIINRRIDFAFDSVSPLSLGTVLAGKTVRSVTLYIETAFDEVATLTIGTEADPDSLMTAAQNDPSQEVGTKVSPGISYLVDTELFLTIDPGLSTEGSGYVEMEIDA